MKKYLLFSQNMLKPLILAIALLGCPLFNAAYADALNNWTSIPVNNSSATTNSFMLSDIAYGNGLYVAVGMNPYLSDFGIILTSPDGTNWTQRTFHNPTNNVLSLGKVVFANGVFVAVGWSGSIYSSTNGIDWTRTQSAPIWNFNDVVYANGLFVAVGDANASLFPPGPNIICTNIYTSTDGFVWVPQRSVSFNSAGRSIFSIVYDGNKFIAAGDEGYVYTSTDATNWSRTTAGSGQRLISVAVGNGTTIIADGSTNIYSQSFGFPYFGQYVSRSTGTDVHVASIIFANGMFIGRGGSPSGDNFIYSRDGFTWIKSSFAPQDTTRGMTVAGNRIAAIAFDSTPFLHSTLYLSDPFVDLGLKFDGSPQLQVSGIIGRTYQLEYFDSPLTNGFNSWQTLTNFALPSSPYVWSDPTATNSSQRLYRAVLLP